MRNADATAGEPVKGHRPFEPCRSVAVHHCRSENDAPGRAQPVVQFDKVHRIGRSGHRFDEPGRYAAMMLCCACATQALGMSEEDLARALEPFRQLSTSRIGDARAGTGLGLPLTKALVEANRANVRYIQRQGRGHDRPDHHSRRAGPVRMKPVGYVASLRHRVSPALPAIPPNY